MQDGPTSVFEELPRVILTTPRLILRTAIEPDIQVIWERVLGDSDVMRHVFQGVPMTLETAGEVMRKFFTFGDTLTGIAILVEKSTSAIIGFAGLFPCTVLGTDDFEIGFVLARQAWGRGIATEIGEAQLAFGFEQLQCGRLLGLADPQNTASIHALDKLGMKYLHDALEPGRPIRSVFCLEAGEWCRRRREQRA